MRDLYQALNGLDYSRAEVLDLFELLEDQRQVCRLSFQAGEFHPLWIQLLEKRNLSWGVETKPYQSKDLYGSNQDLSLQKDQMDLFVAKKPELILKAKEALHQSDHQTVGQLFGYPSCCIQSFVEAIEQDSSRFPQFPLFSGALNKAQEAKRYFFEKSMSPTIPGNTLSFFPCDFACEKALEHAKIRESWIHVFFSEVLQPALLQVNPDFQIRFEL